MASTRDLRRRIKSIGNTSKITKAMQMVSATKMRRAQNQATSSRPYSSTLLSVLSIVAPKLESSLHPLLQKNSSDKVGILMLTTDKGLCGALNTNLFRSVQSQESKEAVFYTVGRKGREFVVRTSKTLEGDFENQEHMDFRLAINIRKFLLASYLEGKVGEVYILYPDFISTLRQEPKFVKILPISPVILGSETTPGSDSGQARMTDKEFLFEPDKMALLDYALTHLIDTQIYQALLETKASEHSARMMAMQSATDNANELVEDLTLTYNGLRQENITKELLEITSAGAALE